jgi:hypothetical protein
MVRLKLHTSGEMGGGHGREGGPRHKCLRAQAGQARAPLPAPACEWEDEAASTHRHALDHHLAPCPRSQVWAMVLKGVPPNTPL